MDGNVVFAYRNPGAQYPQIAPFHPERYPEYAFGLGAVGKERNTAYDAVRSVFHVAGLDRNNFGTPSWNPLKDLIRPGETVLLKPNLIKETHPGNSNGWQYVLTHGSIIRAVTDYVWKALDGRGKVIVADAPQTDSSFEKIIRILGLDEIRDFYRAQGLNFQLLDLRQEEWINQDGVITHRRHLPGDPEGSIAFDLGECSEFEGHCGAGRYYGADYDAEEVNHHHTGGRHEYLIAASAVKCDVIFSLPKLKTHKKAGITVSLKNLVGVTADKNWLPHHTEGSPLTEGDEHPNPDAKHRAERAMVPRLRHLSTSIPFVGTWFHRQVRKIGLQVFGDSEKVIRSGNWWGNDTIWRMCLDLNKIVFYGNSDGTLRYNSPENRKRHYALVDGIVAGEGSGPMSPDPAFMGTVIFGVHPASVDAACAYLMGYDPERIPIVRQAFRCLHYPLTEWDWNDVRLVSNTLEWNGLLADIPDDATFHLEPHFGWKGDIERKVNGGNHVRSRRTLR